MESRVIGVLGGMGPGATVELFNRVVKLTDANKDSEHVNMIIFNDTTIPDRTEFILGNGANPLPKLQENINKLTQNGVKAIAIPCMTAHAFLEDLQRYSPVEIINAINLINIYKKENNIKYDRLGLLATTGSIKSGVYEKYLESEIVIPDKMHQELLMDIIYGKSGIKAGYEGSEIINQLNKVVNSLKQNGAEAVIAGCTELGMVMTNDNTNLPVIDPITLLANEIIEIAGLNVKQN